MKAKITTGTANLQTIYANCHRLKTIMSGNHNGVCYVPLNTDNKLENYV